MSTNKREGSPLAPTGSTSTGTETPTKRARLASDPASFPAASGTQLLASTDAAAGPGPATPARGLQEDVQLESGGGAALGTGEMGSIDSPSAGRGKRGGRGGGAAARGIKHDRRGSGRGGGRGGTGSGRGTGRRDGTGGEASRDEAAAGAADGSHDGGEDKRDKLPKRKVAVLLGYNGIGYKGSQVNPGTETIEGEVFKAFAKAGAISEDNSTNPQKVSLARAARTDAGVHAALNVLALKLILSPPGKAASTSLEDHLNAYLPPAIRVWSVLRLQGSFDPRRQCDQRQYEYTLPTHVLLGPKPTSPMGQMLAHSRAELPAAAASSAGPGAIQAASDAFWAAQPSESSFADDVTARKAWRIPAEGLAQARDFLAAYEGSHNFYNFTVGKDFRDRSCQRVMRKLELSEPFVVNDTEYVSVTFIGQSFMLHQIRKMIGLFILAVRSSTPASLVPETFGPSRIHLPKAPALGLLLVGPHYTEYNRRVVEANAKLDALVRAGRLTPDAAEEQQRSPINPQGIEGMEAQVDEFKREQVYKRMWQVEENEWTFSKWLNYLDQFVGADFGYLNPKGVIPASATFTAGENPERTRRTAGAPGDGVEGAADAAEGVGAAEEEEDEETVEVGGEDDG